MSRGDAFFSWFLRLEALRGATIAERVCDSPPNRWQEAPTRAAEKEVNNRKRGGRVLTLKDQRLPVEPARIRKIPSGGFGWIDRRFFLDAFAAELTHPAVILYCFLCSAANTTGHSWHGAIRMSRLTRLTATQLKEAARELRTASLSIHSDGIWGLLSLPDSPLPPGTPQRSSGQPGAIGDIIRKNQAVTIIQPAKAMGGRGGMGSVLNSQMDALSRCRQQALQLARNLLRYEHEKSTFRLPALATEFTATNHYLCRATATTRGSCATKA